MNRANTWILSSAVCALAIAATLALYAFLPNAAVEKTQQVALAAGLTGLCLLALNGKKERVPKSIGKHFDEIAASSAVSGLTFSDVAANDEARKSLEGLVEYLKDPEKYEKIGARMPRGVMLYGPPGTGKTLLARALAGEANVPFFALTGSDFVQMYVGVGASRVRDLFAKARKAGKCVIFIDEIDALGKRRDDTSSDEREQTLNALLSEMSGFHPNDGTIVIAATNRVDTLDPALLRPGRFDRQIEVGLPGRKERLSILQLHSKNKPFDSEINFESLASDTVFFSGASLEAMLNEAAINAVRRGADVICREDIDRAYLSSVAGEDKVAHASKEERAVIAVHEAGHALATKLLLPEHRLTRVSTLPTGKGAAGYSLSIPPESAVLAKDQLLKQVRVLLAGRAAEMIAGGEDQLTSGAGNDLKRAADLISTMVMDMGMECEPGVALRAVAKSCGSGAPNAFKLCRDALNREFAEVTELLSRNADKLMRLAEALLENEALNGEEVDEMIAS